MEYSDLCTGDGPDEIVGLFNMNCVSYMIILICGLAWKMDKSSNVSHEHGQ